MTNKKDKNVPAKVNKSGAEKRSPFWFYVILAIIPFLVIFLLELSLRMFNYGVDIPQWVTVDKTSQILNPDIAYRYFYNTKSVPQSNQDLFTIEKKSDAFRVFVFGESSAGGYPYIPNGAFTKYLQKRLEFVYPDRTIEVVNLSISATNTFTMLDLFPGMIEQKPDLILFYAGHNEYYGALGVGSMESIGSSRTVVKLVLWLNKFKTVQLLRNTIKSLMDSFSGEKDKVSGTLMSQMAREQAIELNSDLFNAGIDQFEGNMREMLEMAKEADIPVIFGTLASNLKDQKPFISLKSDNLPAANEVYDSAVKELKKPNTKKAEELFRYAKDLDALRFRAPEKINSVIKELAREYNYPFVDIDSAFNNMSPDGIAGDNLMTDHLHPTLEGYRIIGSLYFQKMKEEGLLPEGQTNNISDKLQDSLAIKSIPFSQLDSVIGNFRIAFLKNDWPYIDKKDKKDPRHLFKLRTFIDSIAFKLVNGNTSWENAHREAALWYLSKGRYDLFSREVFVMADQYPFVIEYHQFAADQMISRKQYNLALEHLLAKEKMHPDAFSSKWIGNIMLFRNRADEAIQYLSKSLSYNSQDSQVLYNLAGAYSLKKNYSKAIEAVNRSLAINPNDPAAMALKAQLTGGR